MAIGVIGWSTPFVYFSLLRNSSLFSAAATGLIPGLSRSDILNKTLPLPPAKAEQDAIAEALSNADALIESLEQLLTKKRHLKQAAMQELLTGKKRLPGFSGEWELKRLLLLATIAQGQVDPRNAWKASDPMDCARTRGNQWQVCVQEGRCRLWKDKSQLKKSVSR